MSGGIISSGTTPIWSRSCQRRGEAEARIRRGLAVVITLKPSLLPKMTGRWAFGLSCDARQGG